MKRNNMYFGQVKGIVSLDFISHRKMDRLNLETTSLETNFTSRLFYNINHLDVDYFFMILHTTGRRFHDY